LDWQSFLSSVIDHPMNAHSVDPLQQSAYAVYINMCCRTSLLQLVERWICRMQCPDSYNTLVALLNNDDVTASSVSAQMSHEDWICVRVGHIMRFSDFYSENTFEQVVCPVLQKMSVSACVVAFRNLVAPAQVMNHQIGRLPCKLFLQHQTVFYAAQLNESVHCGRWSLLMWMSFVVHKYHRFLMTLGLSEHMQRLPLGRQHMLWHDIVIRKLTMSQCLQAHGPGQPPHTEGAWLLLPCSDVAIIRDKISAEWDVGAFRKDPCLHFVHVFTLVWTTMDAMHWWHTTGGPVLQRVYSGNDTPSTDQKMHSTWPLDDVY
jgi:hypothetical protein